MKREITKATYKIKDAEGEVIEKTGMVSTEFSVEEVRKSIKNYERMAGEIDAQMQVNQAKAKGYRNANKALTKILIKSDLNGVKDFIDTEVALGEDMEAMEKIRKAIQVLEDEMAEVEKQTGLSLKKKEDEKTEDK